MDTDTTTRTDTMVRTSFTGTITLPTSAQRALWIYEITGQLSDGMWENTRPHSHWKFWGALEVKLGAEASVKKSGSYLGRDYECVKNAYNLGALIPIVGDSMVKVARMAKALNDAMTYEDAQAAEYLPETCVEYLQMRAKDSNVSEYIKEYIDQLTDVKVIAYYMTVYTKKDLRADLNVIKQAMKSVPRY